MEENEAVFYTHGHEDHIGLFEYVPMDVPQFMSAGTKELILIKYRTLQEGNDLHHEQSEKDDYSSKEPIEKTINQNINIANKIELISRLKTWRAVPLRRATILDSGFMMVDSALMGIRVTSLPLERSTTVREAP